MMRASEARERARDGELQYIHMEIEKAIRIGSLSCTIRRGDIFPETRQALEQDGYEVMQDWFMGDRVLIVSWKQEANQ